MHASPFTYIKIMHSHMYHIYRHPTDTFFSADPSTQVLPCALTARLIHMHTHVYIHIHIHIYIDIYSHPTDTFFSADPSAQVLPRALTACEHVRGLCVCQHSRRSVEARPVRDPPAHRYHSARSQQQHALFRSGHQFETPQCQRPRSARCR